MKIAITGGTGYVGGHTVAAIVAAGHEVRLLVRSTHQVRTTLEPLGVDPDEVEVVAADVTDGEAVRVGLDGCDALVHTASVFTYDPLKADTMRRTNVEGGRIVLDAAVDLGLDPIVHVSSIVALVDADAPPDRVVTETTPLGRIPDRYAYAHAKRTQEAYARSLQDAGHPVVVTYPGAVAGPHDPYLGETFRTIRAALRGLYTFVPDGGVSYVDVRDVAAVHAAVLAPGLGPRRFLAAGHFTSIAELVRAAADAAGVRRPTLTVPWGMVTPTGRLGDALARRGTDIGLTSDLIWLARRRDHHDLSHTEQKLDVTFRPTAEAISDTVRWARAAGHL